MGSHSEGLKLFCRIQSTKRGRVLKEAPMSCSHASELVKEELKNERLDPILSSLHSLQSGGALSAAALEIHRSLIAAKFKMFSPGQLIWAKMRGYPP